MPSAAACDLLARLIWPVLPWALVACRVLGACWTAPGLSNPGLSGRSRLVLALGLTAAVGPIATEVLASPANASMLIVALAFELVIGASLGASAGLVVAGARQAGEVVGSLAGLSPASILDPDAGEGSNVLGHLYGWIALGVFLQLSGPTELVGSIARSYRSLPPVSDPSTVDLSGGVDAVFAAVAEALGLAVRAAAAPAIALTLAGLAIGLLGRAAPSLGLMPMSLPVRTLIGLAVAALGLASLAALLGAAWEMNFPFAG